MRYLITGAAGFIGFHTARQLLETGHEVIGLDIINDYYDPKIKYARLALLEAYPGFSFHKLDLVEGETVKQLVADNKPDRVIHLAAQAGVRYSIENPHAYAQSNLIGFLNILEACRHAKTPHLTYASSSSVYGANTKVPFSSKDAIAHPLSMYAATKVANEMMAHSYSNLFQLPTTGLRFFTVYGPWGRPDMALFLFTKAIIAGEPINIFNYGKHQRNFTYIDDIVEGVIRIADSIAKPDPNWDASKPAPDSSSAPYRIYNIGSNKTTKLLDYIDTLEKHLGKKAIRNELPLQPGDVPNTWADCSELGEDFDYAPSTTIEVGIARFVEWYQDYYEN
ncbi:NAD-dependent epimerase [Pseudomonadota bacterium]